MKRKFYVKFAREIDNAANFNLTFSTSETLKKQLVFIRENEIVLVKETNKTYKVMRKLIEADIVPGTPQNAVGQILAIEIRKNSKKDHIF